MRKLAERKLRPENMGHIKHFVEVHISIQQALVLFFFFLQTIVLSNKGS